MLKIKRSIKYILSIILAIVTIMSLLAGCGKDSNGNNSQTNTLRKLDKTGAEVLAFDITGLNTSNAWFKVFITSSTVPSHPGMPYV